MSTNAQAVCFIFFICVCILVAILRSRRRDQDELQELFIRHIAAEVALAELRMGRPERAKTVLAKIRAAVAMEEAQRGLRER